MKKIIGLLTVCVALGISPPAHAQSSSEGRPSTDTGYLHCPDRWWEIETIPELGVKWADPNYGGWTRISAVPAWIVRYGTMSVSWNDAWECMPGGTYWATGWDTYQQQLMCHDIAPFGIGTGPTWDLEGQRSSTWNTWTWISNTCNW